MAFNKDIHHRKSIRLRGYDYSQPGAYFITICTHQRQALFGDVVDGNMLLNAGGRMVEKCWRDLANKFSGIRLGEYITMPNHIHGVVEIVGADLCVCPEFNARVVQGKYDEKTQGAHTGAPLHRMVQWFKTMTTNAYIRGINDAGWPSFDGRLWQRNYYEHVIRNELSYQCIAEYVRSNPQKWQDDTYHV